MVFRQSMLSMIADFVELRRNPEFRSRSELSSRPPAELLGEEEVVGLPLRRHSLSITVGTSVPNDSAVRQRTYSTSAKRQRRKTTTPKMLTSTKVANATDTPNLCEDPPSTQTDYNGPKSVEAKDKPHFTNSDPQIDEINCRRSCCRQVLNKTLRSSMALSDDTITEDWEEEEKPLQSLLPSSRHSSHTVIRIH